MLSSSVDRTKDHKSAIIICNVFDVVKIGHKLIISCSTHLFVMFTNLDLLHLYRLLLGRHAEKNLKMLILLRKKFHRRQIKSKWTKKRRTFTWSTHRKVSVTQLTHVVYSTLLRMTEFALHPGYPSPVKIQNGAEVSEFWAKDCDCNASFGY